MPKYFGSIGVERGLYDLFKKACEARGLSMSVATERLIREWLGKLASGDEE